MIHTFMNKAVYDLIKFAAELEQKLEQKLCE